jgi:hypothetical protein
LHDQKVKEKAAEATGKIVAAACLSLLFALSHARMIKSQGGAVSS